eukprot:4660449-Amphidinium_carterae.1
MGQDRRCSTKAAIRPTLLALSSTKSLLVMCLWSREPFVHIVSAARLLQCNEGEPNSTRLSK